jgi:hypothetical protein
VGAAVCTASLDVQLISAPLGCSLIDHMASYRVAKKPIMKIRAIAVDLGGVLFLSDPSHDMSWAAKELIV